jgi:hypothetical protein
MFVFSHVYRREKKPVAFSKDDLNGVDRHGGGNEGNDDDPEQSPCIRRLDNFLELVNSVSDTLMRVVSPVMVALVILLIAVRIVVVYAVKEQLKP